MIVGYEMDTGHRIAVSGDRFVDPDTAEITVALGTGTLRPGFINAHDHLYWNHVPPLGNPPYPNSYAWAADVQAHHRDRAEPLDRVSRADALRFGALKNLSSGVTTVLHHDRWDPLLEDDFPVRVVRARIAHSLRLEDDWDGFLPADGPTVRSLHLAEGVDSTMADEIREAHGRGLLGPDLLAVHVVGVDQEGLDLLERTGTAVVWCPSSNMHLYRATCPPILFDASLDILLGTDSLVSGGGGMLDELRAARRFGYLDAERLEAAVGSMAARRLGLEIPGLAVGDRADFVWFTRPVERAGPGDVGLVVVGGVPRLGDVRFRDLFDRTGVAVGPICIDGRDKLVVTPLARAFETVRAVAPHAAVLFGSASDHL